MAHAVPPLPQYAATAAAAVGQQQLQQQQLFQLQDRRLLELRGGSPREGLGLAGRDVVSLSKDATAADAVSPSFAVTESLEAVAAAALHRWQEAEAAAAGLPQAAVAASERDDRPFWESLCDRIFSSRDLLPVSSLSALLRLICCRYAPRAAASVPYFLQHFYTQPLDSSRKRQRQQPLQQYRLPSQRPVTASLLLPLTREFIDDVHCISATAAANIAAIFAASNCLSIELLQLLLRRSIDTWMLPEDKLLLQRQKQQQQQKQLRQIFAVKPEAVSRFSAQEFAVFCSSLQHLLQQAQLRQPHSLLFLPLSEFLSSAASLLLSSSKVEDCLQHHAALGSLAALAADALQQLKQEQQQQQQDQLLQLIKASEVLLRASDAFVSRGEEKASEETTGGAALATAAFSSKETARLMSLLSTLRTPDSFSSPQQERQKQGKQPQELPDKVQENNSGPAGGVCADAVLQHQPGAATLLHLLQQVELELVQENSLLQQQLQLVPGQVSGAAVAYDDPSGHVKYTRMNPWEAPTVETLQLMNSVSAAIAATTTILLQPLLLERYHRNVKHPQQRRRCQRLLELLEEVGSPALAEADPSGTLVQAAARRVVRMVFAIIAAAGASLLPGAADACRALLLLLLLPPEARDRWQLQHAVTLKASANFPWGGTSRCCRCRHPCSVCLHACLGSVPQLSYSTPPRLQLPLVSVPPIVCAAVAPSRGDK